MASPFKYLLAGRNIAAPPRHLTDDEKRLIAAAYHECDREQKGYLSREDLKVAVVRLFGYKPSKYEVDRMLQNITKTDSEGKAVMPLDQFVVAMTAKMSAKDEDEEIRQIFLALDHQCRGFLTFEDLKKAFGKVAPLLPDHCVESAFREIDRDGDGRVSFRDFEFMMKFDMDS